jgi:hypothetical protein
MTEQKKPSFLDAIKNAQAMKTKVPQGKTKQVQQAKMKNQVSSNRPTKRAAGRGG